VEQRLSLVTLAVDDVARSRAFLWSREKLADDGS
jgi:hypothetical protein